MASHNGKYYSKKITKKDAASSMNLEHFFASSRKKQKLDDEIRVHNVVAADDKNHESPTKHGIQISEFCKQFNDMTGNMKEGLPLPTWIRLRGDRSIDIKHAMPTTTYFLCSAAGIKKGALSPGEEIAGKVTLKHIYEIAKIKQSEGTMDRFSLENICKMMIGSAHSIGIQVVRDLDPEEYGQFLIERERIVEEQTLRRLEELEAKYLRTKEKDTGEKK